MFNIELCDFAVERKYLDGILKAVDETYDVLYELRESTREEIEADVTSMLKLLDEIEANPDMLQEHADKIRKKKNGMLWKNSGIAIQQLSYCTCYFSDYTNAWSTPELRLDVVNENTCKLSIRSRTYTY